MAVEAFVGPGNQSGIGDPSLRHIVVDVRKVGFNVFEAHDTDGYFSAVGYTAKEAVENLRPRLPKDYLLWRVWYPGARVSVEP